MIKGFFMGSNLIQLKGELDDFSLDVLGLKPEESGIVFCGEDFYSPRLLTAHLNESVPRLDERASHEYVGHGVFCEYSSLGQDLAREDSLTAGLEVKLFGRLLRKGERVECFLCDEPRLEEKGGVTLAFVQDAELYSNYVSARNELRSFNERIIPDYEGFAVFVQSFFTGVKPVLREEPYLSGYHRMKGLFDDGGLDLVFHALQIKFGEEE